MDQILFNHEEVDADVPAVENQTLSGRVRFFDFTKGYGFVSVDRSSKDLYFHISDVLDQKEPPTDGERVTFIQTIDQHGKLRAADVRLVHARTAWVDLNDERPVIRGYVRFFNREKQFGFIDALIDGDMKSVYLTWRAIVPDCRGHRCDCFESCTHVEFILNVNPDRNNLFATNVRAVRRRDDADPEQTEISEVISWKGQFGFLRRSCGEEVIFHDDYILTLGSEGLNEGGRRFVRHKVRPATQREEYESAKQNFGRESYELRYKRTHEAFDVEIFAPGFDPSTELVVMPGSPEAFFLSLPDEPSPAAAPEIEHVYSQDERKLTLRELIAQKRAA